MIDNSFHIITFGCQMNVHDSQWLARALEARGFCEAPLEEARVVVVNTCSVREKPEQKVMSTLGRIRQVTGNSPRVLVAVTGCVAQQLGEKLFSRQVRLVAGSDGISGAPQASERRLDEPALRLSLLDFTSHYVEREPGADTPSAPVGFVNIMQGCDNFCAYSIVPYTRGRQKSRLTPAILDECRHLLDRGAREITLLGQNVNAFGRDTHGDGVSFAALLEKVAALPGLKRLRYVTPHPKDMGPEDVAAFANIPQLCPRQHLPLQAGSAAELKRKGRKYARARSLALVASLRAARPDLALSADLIEGFPYDDGVFMFKVTGQQLRQMLHYMLREEAYTGHTEFYQMPSTLRLRYDRRKGDFDYFTYCGREVGKEIGDDALFTVGLQNYHFKNIESFFNISYDTLCKLQKPRSVATSCQDILMEYFREHEMLDAVVDGRMTILPSTAQTG